MNLEHLVGAVGHADGKVDEMNTSIRCSSGALPIYSFNAMVHLMERAACAAVQDLLPLGSSTIAMKIDVKQITATPIGHHVQAEAHVLRVEGQRIFYKVNAFDEKGKIGEATHERFGVMVDSFMDKISKKNIS